MDFNELKRKVGSFVIKGENIEDSMASLQNLKESVKGYDMTAEELEQIDKLEKLYLTLLEKSIDATPLNINSDGEVEIKDGQIFHRATANSLEDLSRYSYIGIVASEWFGKLESCF